MQMARASREFQKNGDNPAHHRFGLLQPVCALQQLRDVVEADGDLGCCGP